MVEIILSIIASGFITWVISRYYYKSQIEQQNKETIETKKILGEIRDSIKEGSMINAKIFNKMLDESSLSDDYDEYKILEMEESGKYIDNSVDPETYKKYFGVNPDKCKNCGNNSYEFVLKEVPFIECTNCKSYFPYKDLQKQKYRERYKTRKK